MQKRGGDSIELIAGACLLLGLWPFSLEFLRQEIPEVTLDAWEAFSEHEMFLEK